MKESIDGTQRSGLPAAGALERSEAMSRKISIGAALALALLLVAASIPLTMIYAQRMFNNVIPNPSSRSLTYQAGDEIRKLVDTSFAGVLDRDMLVAGLVRGYVAGLGDEQSRYLAPAEYKAYLQRLNGEALELGMDLEYEPGGGDGETEGKAEGPGRLVIAHVKSGSPAAASGLRKGDRIISVQADNKPIFDEKELSKSKAGDILAKLEDISAISADLPSSALTIAYARGAETKSVSVMVGNSVSSLSWEILDAWSADGRSGKPTVGYIKIFNFYKNTAEQLETAIRSLGSQAASYIIDLRGCSEGTLEDACKALNLLVPVSRDGAMATVTYKDGRQEAYPSGAVNSLYTYVSGGMAVLVDGSTGGVAELFAYDLRAYNSSSVFLVGQKTKGISTLQKDFALDHRIGGAALLTVGRITPYLGEEDWNVGGVKPNGTWNGVELEVMGDAMQLRAAVQALTKAPPVPG
jgi:carboxyl-terminal processing protease